MTVSMPDPPIATPGPPGLGTKTAGLHPAPMTAVAGRSPDHPLPPPEPNARQLGFWQHPTVQNLLPLATSVAFHLALIIIGYATYRTVQRVVQVVQEQIIIPESTMADNGPPGGVLHPGVGSDPTRDAAQDLKDLADSQSWATQASDNLNQAVLGGSESDASAMIAVGANAAAGAGTGPTGMGDSTGQLAPFGVPGGGNGAGPRSSFLGVGGNARRVVYVCQASGSMISLYGDLRHKLEESIDALRPIQSFDVIFFADQDTFVFNRGALVMASPDNKRKAYDFIDHVVTHGQTNPIEAINTALALKPELMYVLTDGFYNVSSFDEVINAFRNGNADKKTHVNCLYLESDEDPKLVQVLKQIARENGGVMKSIPKLGF
jgi:hypothetical protein